MSIIQYLEVCICTGVCTFINIQVHVDERASKPTWPTCVHVQYILTAIHIIIII